MWTALLDWCLSALLFALYGAGVLLLFDRSFRWLWGNLMLRHRLRRTRRDIRQQPLPLAYVRRLLAACFDKPPSEHRFLLSLSLLFTTLCWLGGRYFSPATALLLSLMVTSLPLFFMILRLEVRRTRASREGVALLSELYRNYRMAHRNIYAALEETVGGRGDFPICKSLLYRLLLRLRSSGSPGETREAVEAFAFSSGTVWGKMLGFSIGRAAGKGTDVSMGLLDLNRRLADAARREEVQKRQNSEAVRMTVFFLPFLYAGTVWAAIRYLGMTPAKFMRNQFATSEGLALFTAAFVLFAFNLAVAEWLKNRKLDI